MKIVDFGEGPRQNLDNGLPNSALYSNVIIDSSIDLDGSTSSSEYRLVIPARHEDRKGVMRVMFAPRPFKCTGVPTLSRIFRMGFANDIDCFDNITLRVTTPSVPPAHAVRRVFSYSKPAESRLRSFKVSAAAQKSDADGGLKTIGGCARYLSAGDDYPSGCAFAVEITYYGTDYCGLVIDVYGDQTIDLSSCNGDLTTTWCSTSFNDDGAFSSAALTE